MSSAHLRLRLFGSPAVTQGDGLPLSGGSLEPQRLALLALLALHPKRTVSRADLTRYLWPAMNGDQARQALNQALFAISKALGDDAIFPSAKEVRLGGRVSVDALDFQAALEDGRPVDAMQLYTAPLLDGFELDDAPEFQHWAATQRARFATAGRTQRPVAEAADEVLHDLTAPESAESTAEVAPVQTPRRSKRRKPAPVTDFILAEPVIQARVEPPTDAPELRASVPPEPELLTNAPPVEQERSVDSVPAEPALMTNAVPEREPEQSIPPSPPAPPALIESSPIESPPIESPPIENAPVESPPIENPPIESPPIQSPPHESEPAETPPDEKRAKRPKRAFHLPSARSVVIVLALIALGAFGYMARGWIGVARRGIASVRARADAARQARDRERSIAVLPIQFSGRDPADAALAARIVAELGPKLTRAGLIVIPSTALTRGGPPYDLRGIADSLSVGYILQGVMQREDARVAFRFRLANPVDGTTRWDYTYRPNLADIPVLEEDVAETVAKHILQTSREQD
jgi:TolB-like protein